MSWLNRFMNWVKEEFREMDEEIIASGEHADDNVAVTDTEVAHPTSSVTSSVVQAPTATAMSVEEQIFEIASHYNSGETKVYYPVRTDASGTLNAYIGHNDSATNKLVAQTIVAAAKDAGLDPFFLASVIQQESIFSPSTYNHNLSKSHLTPDFPHTDWGISQFSGAYLPSKPGMSGLSEDEMQAKALDPTWAIPLMAQVYAGLVVEASKNLNTDTVLASAVHALNTTSFTDAQWLGTLAYNRGFNGAVTDVKNNSTTLMNHPFRCANWYSQFISFAKNGIFVSSKSLGTEDESERFIDHELR